MRHLGFHLVKALEQILAVSISFRSDKNNCVVREGPQHSEMFTLLADHFLAGFLRKLQFPSLASFALSSHLPRAVIKSGWRFPAWTLNLVQVSWDLQAFVKRWVGSWAVVCLALVWGERENYSRVLEVFLFFCLLDFSPGSKRKILLGFRWSQFPIICFFPCVWEGSLWFVCPHRETTLHLTMLMWQTEIIGWIISPEIKSVQIPVTTVKFLL